MLTDASARPTDPASIEESDRKVKVFSGIQPSGNFHLGASSDDPQLGRTNRAQRQHLLCCRSPRAVEQPRSRRASAEHLRSRQHVARVRLTDACLLFVQSDVPAHSELQWLLNSGHPVRRVAPDDPVQDKSAGKGDSVSAAVLSYPVLMAADIILYDAEEVPVGDDQRQHVELTRDIVQRFNTRYGETFVMPKADIKSEAARIMALDNPTEKMSKSSGRDASYILFSDTPAQIQRKSAGRSPTRGRPSPRARTSRL